MASSSGGAAFRVRDSSGHRPRSAAPPGTALLQNTASRRSAGTSWAQKLLPAPALTASVRAQGGDGGRHRASAARSSRASPKQRQDRQRAQVRRRAGPLGSYGLLTSVVRPGKRARYDSGGEPRRPRAAANEADEISHQVLPHQGSRADVSSSDLSNTVRSKSTLGSLAWSKDRRTEAPERGPAGASAAPAQRCNGTNNREATSETGTDDDQAVDAISGTQIESDASEGAAGEGGAPSPAGVELTGTTDDAADELARQAGVASIRSLPDYAVVAMFLLRFGSLESFAAWTGGPFSFGELESAVLAKSPHERELRRLICGLLNIMCYAGRRRARKVSEANWHAKLVSLVHESLDDFADALSSVDSAAQFDFFSCSSKQRLCILRVLCDLAMSRGKEFHNEITSMVDGTASLRGDCLGICGSGRQWYFCEDAEVDIRVWSWRPPMSASVGRHQEARGDGVGTWKLEADSVDAAEVAVHRLRGRRGFKGRATGTPEPADVQVADLLAPLVETAKARAAREKAARERRRSLRRRVEESIVLAGMRRRREVYTYNEERIVRDKFGDLDA